MRTALYKVDYTLGDASGRSVMYARDGIMLGGNSAFAHTGWYRTEPSGDIDTEITISRHYADSTQPSLLGADDATDRRHHGPEDDAGPRRRLALEPQLIAEVAPARDQGYSLHIEMLDGVAGKNSGVMLLLDGRILGGDAFFYYLGSYSAAGGRWKGEMLNQEHTPAKDARPLFGGHEVGIGFSGTYDADSAQAEATALAGKRSIRFAAALKLLRAV